jgi:hypothetical protein
LTHDALAGFHSEPGLALFFKPIGRLFLATWGKLALTRPRSFAAILATANGIARAQAFGNFGL